MDKPWKSYILSVDQGTYIIGGGKSQGLRVNDLFVVYKKGKEVVNPQTGIKIELPGEKIGKLTLLSLYGDTPETEISLCSYEGTAIDSANLSQYYIQVE
jgi:hypothetical protein